MTASDGGISRALSINRELGSSSGVLGTGRRLQWAGTGRPFRVLGRVLVAPRSGLQTWWEAGPSPRGLCRTTKGQSCLFVVNVNATRKRGSGF